MNLWDTLSSQKNRQTYKINVSGDSEEKKEKN